MKFSCLVRVLMVRLQQKESKVDSEYVWYWRARSKLRVIVSVQGGVNVCVPNRTGDVEVLIYKAEQVKPDQIVKDDGRSENKKMIGLGAKEGCLVYLYLWSTELDVRVWSPMDPRQ